jgi:hypothetical protein
MVLSDKEIYKFIHEGKLVFGSTDKSLPFNKYEQVQPSLAKCSGVLAKFATSPHLSLSL